MILHFRDRSGFATRRAVGDVRAGRLPVEGRGVGGGDVTVASHDGRVELVLRLAAGGRDVRGRRGRCRADVVLRADNERVALRYRFPDRGDGVTRTVVSEATGLTLHVPADGGATVSPRVG